MKFFGGSFLSTGINNSKGIMAVLGVLYDFLPRRHSLFMLDMVCCSHRLASERNVVAPGCGPTGRMIDPRVGGSDGSRHSLPYFVERRNHEVGSATGVRTRGSDFPFTGSRKAFVSEAERTLERSTCV